MDVSIEFLDCGSLSGSHRFFEEGAPKGRLTLPVASFVIRHQKGTAIFDTGMHTQIAEGGPLRDQYEGLFGFEVDSSHLVGNALHSSDLDPDDIDIVILSHLHFDHAGGLAQLPNARVIVQEDEWDAGHDPDIAEAEGFRPEEFDLGHDLVLISGEHDVFGDGTVTCLPTPGHTPGHQSVVVKLAHSEVVLYGDCAYFERTMHGAPLPRMSFDREKHRASLDSLKAMQAAGAFMIPGHDPEVFAKLPARIS